MGHPLVMEHSVIGRKSSRECQVKASPYTTLSSPKDSPFCALLGDHPAGGKGRGVNGRGLARDYVSIQRCVYT